MLFDKLFHLKNTTNEYSEMKKMKKMLSKHTPLYSSDIRCNTQKGLISVILPVYNGEKYLEASIYSVLNQTYTNLELIIVDDGSGDSSGAIADRFMKEDSRVSVIHQKNMKLPAALNNGFSAAKGEFLTWTSADNKMLGSCLEILSSELIRDRFCDMVYANMRLIDSEGNVLKGYGWYEFPPLSGNVILPDSASLLNIVANNTIGAAFLYRAGAASVLNGYSENRYLLEDYDYFMRMNSLFNIKHTSYSKPIYEYRIHNESLTSRDEELGITASRPALMDFDKKRRDFYKQKLYFYADGCDKGILRLLCSSAIQVTSCEEADKLASESLPHIFYVNFGDCNSRWTPPSHIPKFVICDEAADGVFGYDAMLCRNAVSLTDKKGWISPSDDRSAASFIILRAKNDLLYNYEGTYNK